MKMNLTVVIGLLSLFSLRNFGFCQDVGAVAIKPQTADAGSLGSTLFIVQTGNASTETVHGQWEVTEPVTSISDDNKPSSKIRHRHQKGRLGTNSSSGTPYLSSKSYDDPASLSTVDNQIEDINYDETGTKDDKEQKLLTPAALQKSTIRPVNPNATSKPYRIRASGSRKAILLAAGPGGNQHTSVRTTSAATSPSVNTTVEAADTSWSESSGRSTPTYLYHNGQISQITSSDTPSGSPNLDNWFRAIGEADEDSSKVPLTDLENNDYENSNLPWLNDPSDTPAQPNLDIVTKFLRIVESQHLLGTNCTAGTDFNLGEGVVDRYAQERFRLEADIAVNRANWLTRLWKYAEPSVMESEYLLHANLFSMIEMDEDIFAAGNCHDKYQYKDYELVCPFAYRLPNGTILAKDLAAEYNYLTNTSEFFYIARKNAERVIRNMTNIIKGQHMYTANATGYSEFFEDEILSVTYEDGKWSKPYFDCGGGNIWMMTYTVPFFGYANGTYFFKGTSGIDIDLRRVDIDQCPQRPGNTQLNIFAASDKCKPRTTKCVHISGLGFRRGSYRCECKDGFYFPDKNTTSSVHYYNGTVIEEEYEKKLMGLDSVYEQSGVFECLPCPEGCDVCVDDSPCIVTLNWAMRTSILILEIIVICCLPAVAAFTWRYAHIKVVRAASPALLRLIIVGSFFIYCTTLVTYPRPNVVTCTLRIWFREIGFSFAYGALMLKTWRISVIFRVRSAKAVKITDLDLIKRLGVIVAIFTVFLSIRTLVAPPHVIVARTADDLKAYICQTDWWDHVFTAMEMVLLVWGIRLCIVVRKAPSEFNESRFISMAIYNEFLLSVFLNVSMLFLQSPANPDLMYIIVFSHTQLTTTLLLVLIFGSKAYLVLRGRGKGDDNMIAPKPQAAKFLSKAKTTNSHVTPSSMGSHRLEIPGLAAITDPELQEEIRRIFAELEQLREKNVRLGNRAFASRIATMLHVARQNIVSDPMSTESATIAPLRLEDGPSNCSACDGDVRQRKQQSKKKSGKSPGSPEPSGLGSLMFPSSGGPYVNNVLACMTDKIVCATFSADPNLPNENDFTERDAEEICALEMEKDVYTLDGKPVAVAPASSLAIAAAPLLTPSFSLSASMSAMLEGHPGATDARGSSYQQEATSCSDQKLPSPPPPLDESVLISEEQQEDMTSVTVDVPSGEPQPDTTTPGSTGDSPGVAEVYRRGSVGSSESAANDNCDNVCPQVVVEVDSTVKSAQVDLRVRPQLNTSDRERFTDELTV